MNLIGLVGKKGSGKDTVFNIIFELWNRRIIEYRPIRLSFADALKQDLCTAFNCTMDDINNNKNNDIIRKVLQAYGCARREEDPDYWIQRVHENLESHERCAKSGVKYLYIITDVRFFNEADYVRRMGGRLVKVSRPVQGELGLLDTHISETELDKIACSQVIRNDGSLKLLELPVTYMLEQLGFV